MLCVSDVGSTFGTYLNGKRLSEPKRASEPFKLKPQDCISVGQTSLRWQPIEAEPPRDAAVRAALSDSLWAGAALDGILGFRLIAPPHGATEPHLPLVLAESAGGICGRVWDSGLALARALGGEQGHSLCGGEVRGLRIIELGSGVGVSGIAAAALGARVLVTDLEEALPLLRINAEANAARCVHAPTVAALEWGCDEAAVAHAFECSDPGGWWDRGGDDDGEASAPRPALVLCSDVVYEPAAYEPLVQTMTVLATRFGATRTIMAHRSRHPDEHLFFHSIARRFSMRLVAGPPFRPLNAAAEPEPVEDGEAAASDAGSAVRILEFVFCGS